MARTTTETLSQAAYSILAHLFSCAAIKTIIQSKLLLFSDSGM